MAIGVYIDPCWHTNLSMIPKYRFLSQFYGYFVPVFYILIYVKEVVFTNVIVDATVYHQSERDIDYFFVSSPDVIWKGVHPHGFNLLFS